MKTIKISIPRWLYSTIWSILILGMIGVFAATRITNTAVTGSTDVNTTNVYADNINSVLYVQAGNASDIQAKIDSANDGDKIILPQGTLRTNSVVNVTKRLTIEGKGDGSVISKYGGTPGSAWAIQIKAQDGVVLRNFKIIQSSDDDGIEVDSSSNNTLVEYVTIVGNVSTPTDEIFGIHFYGGENNKALYNDISGSCWDAGIRTHQGTTNYQSSQILGNKIHDIGNKTNGASIASGTGIETEADGESDGNATFFNIISKNHVWNNVGYGIRVIQCSYCNVEGNNIYNSNDTAIWIKDTENSSFTDNMIYKTNKTGIYVTSSSHYNDIKNNHIINPAVNSMYLEASSSYNEVEGNYFLSGTDVINDGIYNRIGENFYVDGNEYMYNTISSEGMVLGLNFNSDGISGTTALDSSEYYNDGTISSVTFQKVGGFNGGGYYVFDGTNDNITIPYANGDETDITSNLTLSAWVYIPSLQSDQEMIIYKGSSTTDRYSLLIRSDNYLEFHIRIGGQEKKIQSANLAPTGEWVHVLGTYDGVKQYLYVNGANKSVSRTGAIDSGGGLLMIGCESDDEYFNGYIDDVRIYNRSMSYREVLALYNEKQEVQMPVLSRTDGGKIYGSLTGATWVNKTQEYQSYTYWNTGATRPTATEGVCYWNTTAGYKCTQCYNSTDWKGADCNACTQSGGCP